MKGAAGPTSGAQSLVADEFGIAVGDRGSSVGLSMAELIQVGLRRNPRRAQLLVSTVLGKHLPADPRLIVGMGRLLGALVARKLVDDDDVPASWSVAARAAVSGTDPGGLLEEMDSAQPPPRAAGSSLLTFGFAETATSVGHLVADQLHSDYLHSTRRRDGDIPIAADFTEPHSHATGHLLRPERPALLCAAQTVVLVDDELSTGRTALNVIEVMQALTARPRYVLAGLVDVRSPADDEMRADVARRLGCRIDVVSLVTGEITVPAATVDRVAAEVAEHEPLSQASGSAAANLRRIELRWPDVVPQGGRHGFLDADRVAFDGAIEAAAEILRDACGDADRILVLGTEELMYLPLRLAAALGVDPSGVGRPPRVVFQSTTRSPVHAIDRAGYPIRRRIDFQARVLGANGEPPSVQSRHVYNCDWTMGGDSAEKVRTEAEMIVVIDDGHLVPGPTGLAESLATATGAPVLVAVLTLGAGR